MGGQRSYLGSNLAPVDFYKVYANQYYNPHREGIETCLSALNFRLSGRVLDLGCGDGLVTRWLLDRRRDPRWKLDVDPIGVDASPEMVSVYTVRMGQPAVVARFGDTLPACDSAVISYSLHLAPPVESAVVWYRLAEAGAKWVLVISPFRDSPERPKHYFKACDYVVGLAGAKRKTIHAWTAERTV